MESRVLKIEKKIKRSDWYHIRGLESPADCSSRGILPSEIKNHELWWTGPKFLNEPNFAEKINDEYTTNEEIELTSHVIVSKSEFFHEFNTLSKLKRVIVYVLRFIANLKSKEKKVIDRNQ